MPHERLDLFQDRLDGIFGQRARFMVLSGEEEVPYLSLFLVVGCLSLFVSSNCGHVFFHILVTFGAGHFCVCHRFCHGVTNTETGHVVCCTRKLGISMIRCRRVAIFHSFPIFSW